jgi:hypothetical protein
MYFKIKVLRIDKLVKTFSILSFDSKKQTNNQIKIDKNFSKKTKKCLFL